MAKNNKVIEELVTAYKKTAKDVDFLELRKEVNYIFTEFNFKYKQTLDQADIESCGVLVLYDCIYKHDVERGAVFTTFFQACFLRSLTADVNKATAIKRGKSVTGSLDKMFEDRDEDKVGDLQLRTEDYDIGKFEVLNDIKCLLNEKEYKFCEIVLQGKEYDNTHLSEQLGVTTGGVSYIRKNLRKKLKNYFTI